MKLPAGAGWVAYYFVENNILCYKMDEEESSFYFEGFNVQQEEKPQSFSVESPVQQPQSSEPFKVKAFNPFEYAENLPLKDQQKYLNYFMHNKSYAGLTHFVNFEKTENVPEFFNSIHMDSLDNQDWTENPLHLDELFEGKDENSLRARFLDIQSQIQAINKKALNSINIVHTVMPSFGENFDNFVYLNSHINFIKDLEVRMVNFVDSFKSKSNPQELIIQIYDFWMKSFENFVLSIKKHTQRYTLTVAKRLKEKDGSNLSNHEGKSTSSSRVMEVEKRRAWKQSELEMLYKIIQTNSAFNQVTINKVAEDLNRTPASVSSKIQKILKDHKVSNPDYEVHENMTLMEKITNVLKNYPNGLSRQSVIERVNEHYEMGFDMSWEKSVAQILSSKSEFVKIKGTYSLNGHLKFDMSKKTFKDKVVNCLLSIPEGKADLKRLVDQYINLYGTSEGISILSDERRKTIEASISKSLCRYDIFNKDKSKTVYKLRQFCDEKQCEMEIQNYLN